MKFYREEADWFLKADDDTFIVMENLKSFLGEHDPEEPLQFGCKLKQLVKEGRRELCGRVARLSHTFVKSLHGIEQNLVTDLPIYSDNLGSSVVPIISTCR